MADDDLKARVWTGVLFVFSFAEAPAPSLTFIQADSHDRAKSHTIRVQFFDWSGCAGACEGVSSGIRGEVQGGSPVRAVVVLWCK